MTRPLLLHYSHIHSWSLSVKDGILLVHGQYPLQTLVFAWMMSGHITTILELLLPLKPFLSVLTMKHVS